MQIVNKPPPWNVNPAYIAQEWAWAWDSALLACVPYWQNVAHEIIQDVVSSNTVAGVFEHTQHGNGYRSDAQNEVPRWANNQYRLNVDNESFAWLRSYHMFVDELAGVGGVRLTETVEGYWDIYRNGADCQFEYFDDGAVGRDITLTNAFADLIVPGHNIVAIRHHNTVVDFILNGKHVIVGQVLTNTIGGAGTDVHDLFSNNNGPTGAGGVSDAIDDCLWYWKGANIPRVEQLLQLSEDPWGPLRYDRRQRVYKSAVVADEFIERSYPRGALRGVLRGAA